MQKSRWLWIFLVGQGIWICAAACSPLAAAPRVALVHGSYGNFRHRNDYDSVMKHLGWTLDKFENKNFAQLVAQLDNYDFILGTALFNYAENVQDFSVYKEPLWAFMERGGAIVLTDTNYADHVQWLARWGEDWKVGLQSCQTTSTPNLWLDRRHPIFCGMYPVKRLGATWMHMQPGAGWQIIAKCADEGATALFRVQGRGYMLLTSYWGYDGRMLENLWATLQYTRAGILPYLPDFSQLTLGENKLRGSFHNLTPHPLSVTMHCILQGGEPPKSFQEYSATATAPAGQMAEMPLIVPLKQRGRYQAQLSLSIGEGPVFAPIHAEIYIPHLVELELLVPKYRGVFMQAGWGTTAASRLIQAQATLHPLGERLENCYQHTRLWEGKTLLAQSLPQRLRGQTFTISLPLKRAPHSDCWLELALLRGPKGPVWHKTQKKIPVIASQPHQAFIDEALNLRVEGQLFFPIAIYHVPIKDFARVKALGFNVIQAWGMSERQAQENLDAAHKAGLKVILEGTTHLARQQPLEVLAPLIEKFRSHPALLSWYLTDEPSGEEQLEWCRRVYEYLQQQDPHHPVYLTSCSPGEFAAYVSVTDIFAVDPYPIPKAPITMVSEWMKRAQEAAAGRKPVWLIPQLHNWEAYSGRPEAGRAPTPEEERNMIYQGLVWGAKGIFYYPWDDGCTGLVYEEKLQGAVKQINAELAALGPELLQCSYKLTAQNEEAHPGLYAATYEGEKNIYIIAVNVTKEGKIMSVPAPPGQNARADVLFEGRSLQIAEGKIVDRFAPLAVHVYRIMKPAR